MTLKKFFKLFLKLVLLGFILSFEQVIGVPWLFFFLSLYWLSRLPIHQRSFFLAFLSLFLASFYHLSLWFSLIMVVGLYYLYLWSAEFMKTKVNRMMILSWLASVLMLFLSKLDWLNAWLLLQFLSSFILMIVLKKMPKSQQSISFREKELNLTLNS